MAIWFEGEVVTPKRFAQLTIKRCLDSAFYWSEKDFHFDKEFNKTSDPTDRENELIRIQMEKLVGRIERMLKV